MKNILLLLMLASTNLFAFSEKDYLNFAFDLQESINNKNAELFRKSFDMEAFLGKALVLSYSSKELTDYKREFSQGLSSSFNLGQSIIDNLGEVGFYSFLKYYTKNDEHHLLFRIYTDGGGINYHDFEVKRVRRAVKIIDCYVFMAGENMSESVRRAYTSAFNDVSTLDVAPLESVSKAYAIGTQTRKLMQEKEFKKAQMLFNTIDSVNRKQKSLQLLHIQLSSALEEEVYVNAINEYEGLFPNDPSLNLVSIDGYFFKKNYSAVLDNIKKLEQQLPIKDPLLNLLRANCYYAMQKYDSAAMHFDFLVNDFAGYETFYWSSTESHYLAGHIEQALNVLDLIVEQLGYTKDDINLLLDESDLVSTELYKQWFRDE